jgi:capsule biosynthesis phosphatase
MKMKSLVIDLDHTICTPVDGEDQRANPDLKYSNAAPNDALIERMREYRDSGFRITIHTSRNMRTYDGDVAAIRLHTLPIIIDWLDRHNVPYDEIVVGKPWCGFDGFYIDDRAIRPSEFRDLAPDEIDALLARERAA